MAYLNATKHCFIVVPVRPRQPRLLVKNLVEAHRSRNELGHLVWQLNEVWPTGGWGSLEYGGRWKPHHYWYAKSLFRDVGAACDRTGRCYVRNDRSHRTFTERSLSTLWTSRRAARPLLSRRIALAPGPAVVERFSAPLGAVDATRTVLCLIKCVDDAEGVVSSSELILARPADLRLPARK